MSASDFNKLLDEKHEGDSHVKAPQRAELYDEYIKLHLPDEIIGGEKTNRLEDGVQLGAIYFVEYDDADDNDGYWFVVGYTERWGLEMFYGENVENRITYKSLTVWKGLRNMQYPPQNNIITDSLTIRRIVLFFIVEAMAESLAEIFIAYSPYPHSPYRTISRTLNFSKRGFMQ